MLFRDDSGALNRIAEEIKPPEEKKFDWSYNAILFGAFVMAALAAIFVVALVSYKVKVAMFKSESKGKLCHKRIHRLRVRNSLFNGIPCARS
jgi:hypothetical protein